jgi:hypothetical protein
MAIVSQNETQFLQSTVRTLVTVYQHDKHVGLPQLIILLADAKETSIRVQRSPVKRRSGLLSRDVNRRAPSAETHGVGSAKFENI